MTGQIALVIRFLLYPLAGALISRGLISPDAEAGFSMALAELIVGLAIYAGTIIWSRIAARHNGAT